MDKPKRRYTNEGGMTKGYAGIEFHMYKAMLNEDLVSVRCASMVLDVKLQAVVKLGLPRYMVEKRAAYRKGDIQALLLADRDTPNAVLRDLQEEHRQAQIKQKVHPSRRYKAVPDLLPDEARKAKEATKSNRNKPVTKNELMRDPWLVLKLRRSR